MNAAETIAALTTLDGVWRGEGEGYLPNGEAFAYREQTSFIATARAVSCATPSRT